MWLEISFNHTFYSIAVNENVEFSDTYNGRMTMSSGNSPVDRG